MISAHRLHDSDISELATGRGGTEVLRRLSDGQLSRRLLQLRALMTASRDMTAGDVGALHAGYELAAKVQQAAPRIVADLLTYPSTGTWLGHCLRRLRGTVTGEQPLRADLGHLAAIAAAAAVRAGETFEIDLPLRAGDLMLPTLGLARFGPDVDSRHARLRGSAGGLEIQVGRRAVVMPADPAADGPGWLGLRRLSATHGPAAITLALDDIDPFRVGSDLVAEERVPDSRIAGWQHALDAAWPILAANHPWYAGAIGAGLVMLVPLTDRSGQAAMSATSRDAFGACMLSMPREGQSFAVTLVHEFQHGKLGALQDLVTIYRPGPDVRGYSPWRDDPRPLGGILQGAYAYLGVTDFWRSELGTQRSGRSAYAAFEYIRWREQTSYAVDVLATSPRLTAAGQELVAGMRRQLEQWQSDELPPDPARVAAAAIADHRLSWRLHNLRPDSVDVERLAADWLSGARPSAVRNGPEVVRSDRALLHNARIDLICRQLGGSVPSGVADEAHPDACRAANRAYVTGDLAEAEHRYRSVLSADSCSTEAFAGLALTGSWPRQSAMLRAPELVLAVYRCVRERSGLEPEPRDLAHWLGQIPGWVDIDPPIRLDRPR